jgi:hypothetical protein
MITSWLHHLNKFQVGVEDGSLKYFWDRQTAFKEVSYDKSSFGRWIGQDSAKLRWFRVRPSPNSNRLCSVHQNHGTVASSVLNDDVHVAQTSALAEGDNNVALCPFSRLMQAFGSLAWVLRFFGALVLRLATLFCHVAVSCPQALFFGMWAAFGRSTYFVLTMIFYLYLQVCDF